MRGFWYNGFMKSKEKFLIIGNWKANPNNLALARKYFSSFQKKISKYKNVDLVICPPFIFLEDLKKLSRGVVLGSQDFFYEPFGAFTGEVGYEALVSARIKYAIVGHSERRARGEDNEIVNKKLIACMGGNIKPILCVGEKDRDQEMSYLSFIKEQIETAFRGIPQSKVKNIVIAYEPVWAIGKNAKRDATPKEIEEIAIFIKRVIGDLYHTKSLPPVKILYGGSVNTKNVEKILGESGVSGVLVGSASLKPVEFAEIVEVANFIKR